MIFPSGGNYHGVCHPPHDFYLEELQVKLRPVSSQFWGAGPSLLCVAANIFTDKQLEIHSFYHTASWSSSLAILHLIGLPLFYFSASR